MLMPCRRYRDDIKSSQINNQLSLYGAETEKVSNWNANALERSFALSEQTERFVRPLQCAVIGCKLKQNANEGCNSFASLAGLVLSFIVYFIACFITVRRYA